jgi:hypothetical protein
LETRELGEKVNKVIELLEGFRGFDPRVDNGILAFKFISECLSEPSPEKVQRSQVLVTEFQEVIGPYRGYVPEVASTLELLKEWLNSLN